MSDSYKFQYTPLEGPLPGKDFERQTEDAINDLGTRVVIVEENITEVKTTAENAYNLAVSAQNTADAAQTAANNAQATADTALGLANEGIGNASEALAAAKAAQATADTAVNDAAAAQSTADTAIENAAAAQASADAAQETADAAAAAAEAAANDAAAAQSTADTAIENAAAAQASADAAQETADAAADSADSANSLALNAYKLGVAATVYTIEEDAVNLDEYTDFARVYILNTDSENLPTAEKGWLDVDETDETDIKDDNPDEGDPDSPGDDNPDEGDPDDPGDDNPDEGDPDSPGDDNPDDPGDDNPGEDNPDDPDIPGNPGDDNPDEGDPDSLGDDNPDEGDPDNPDDDEESLGNVKYLKQVYTLESGAVYIRFGTFETVLNTDAGGEGDEDEGDEDEGDGDESVGDITLVEWGEWTQLGTNEGGEASGGDTVTAGDNITIEEASDGSKAISLAKSVSQASTEVSDLSAACGTDIAFYTCTSDTIVSISAAALFANSEDSVRTCLLIINAAEHAPVLEWTNCILFCDAPALTLGLKTIVTILATKSTAYVCSSIEQVSEA